MNCIYVTRTYTVVGEMCLFLLMLTFQYSVLGIINLHVLMCAYIISLSVLYTHFELVLTNIVGMRLIADTAQIISVPYTLEVRDGIRVSISFKVSA